jgi:purine-nucleoside phosphorylase
MDGYYDRMVKAMDYIMRKLPAVPWMGIILGSGLGTLADEIKYAVEIDYADIPNFPLTTVKGHEGKFVFGELAGKPVLAMKGRFHYYEGYDVQDVVFPVRVMKLLGIGNLLVTNAAGGINRSFSPGDLMLIKDHISLFAPSPLRGANLEKLGSRFPDMSEAYSRSLLEMAEKAAEEAGVEIRKGVYAFAKGPMYETPAEIKALSILGADAVGMSTVPEVIAAKHADMRVLGISCITNMAAGILDQPLNHEEVIKTAKEVERKFALLVRTIIVRWQV